MGAVAGDDDRRVVRQTRHLVKDVPAQVDEFHSQNPPLKCARAWNLGQSTSFVGREYSQRGDVFCWRLQMGTVLLIILILLLIGALPTWPYSSGWGYYPSGGLGLVLVIVLILVLLGRV
jgi:hypothetical protein